MKAGSNDPKPGTTMIESDLNSTRYLTRYKAKTISQSSSPITPKQAAKRIRSMPLTNSNSTQFTKALNGIGKKKDKNHSRFKFYTTPQPPTVKSPSPSFTNNASFPSISSDGITGSNTSTNQQVKRNSEIYKFPTSNSQMKKKDTSKTTGDDEHISLLSEPDEPKEPNDSHIIDIAEMEVRTNEILSNKENVTPKADSIIVTEEDDVVLQGNEHVSLQPRTPIRHFKKMSTESPLSPIESGGIPRKTRSISKLLATSAPRVSINLTFSDDFDDDIVQIREDEFNSSTDNHFVTQAEKDTQVIYGAEPNIPDTHIIPDASISTKDTQVLIDEDLVIDDTQAIQEWNQRSGDSQLVMEQERCINEIMAEDFEMLEDTQVIEERIQISQNPIDHIADTQIPNDVEILENLVKTLLEDHGDTSVDMGQLENNHNRDSNITQVINNPDDSNMLPDFQITDSDLGFNTNMGLELNEINSSPIKNVPNLKHASYCKKPDTRSSSPIRSSSPYKKKRVVFSDDLFSDAPPSSPIMHQTPIKSILKTNLNFQRSNARAVGNTNDKEDPSSESFWSAGSIIQLPKNSDEAQLLVTGCLKVLGNENFDKKFEVYATLNHTCKNNPSDQILRFFHPHDSNLVGVLVKFIKRDILAVETKLFSESDVLINDPFSTRIAIQALKLMHYISASVELNKMISPDDAKWVLLHACELMIHPLVSKSLVIPYLQIIKDSKLHIRKKDPIVNFDLSEKLLSSIINMKFFPSSSIICEKLVILRIFITNFPAMMSKNFNSWFGFLMINLCDLDSPLYTRIVTVGISTLMEVAKFYLDSQSVNFNVLQFMEKPLPVIKSLSSDSEQILPDIKVFEFIIGKLEELVLQEQYKFAMDIWLSISLLVCDHKGIENWKRISPWLRVHKLCFNQQSTFAKVTALKSWKCMVYNCCKELTGLKLDDMVARSKLLVYPILNVTAVEHREIIDTLHNLFLSMMYNLINPISSVLKLTMKNMSIYWDRIIQPVMVSFYFSKDHSSAYMHQLGLRFMNRLLKCSVNSPEKGFYNPLMCLDNDPVSINDINSINPRWIYLNFDKFLKNFMVIFKLEKISIDLKNNLLLNFLNNLKLITKREVKPSDETLEITENMPFVLENLLRHNRVSFDGLYKILVNLNDTFGATNLINDTQRKNVYEVIIRHAIDIEPEQLHILLKLVANSLGNKSLLFTAVLVKSSQRNATIDNFITNQLDTKMFTKISYNDLISCKVLFKHLCIEFEPILKRLIQSIILLKENDLQKSLQILEINNWNMRVFNFYTFLMHDAPSNMLKQFTLNLLLIKWADDESFIESMKYLVAFELDFEIYNLRTQLLKKMDTLNDTHRSHFNDVWSVYLLSLGEKKNYSLMDELLVLFLDSSFEVSSVARKYLNHIPRLKSLLPITNVADDIVTALDRQNESIYTNSNKLIDVDLSGTISSSEIKCDTEISDVKETQVIVAPQIPSEHESDSDHDAFEDASDDFIAVGDAPTANESSSSVKESNKKIISPSIDFSVNDNNLKATLADTLVVDNTEYHISSQTVHHEKEAITETGKTNEAEQLKSPSHNDSSENEVRIEVCAGKSNKEESVHISQISKPDSQLSEIIDSNTPEKDLAIEKRRDCSLDEDLDDIEDFDSLAIFEHPKTDFGGIKPSNTVHVVGSSESKLSCKSNIVDEPILTPAVITLAARTECVPSNISTSVQNLSLSYSNETVSSSKRPNKEPDQGTCKKIKLSVIGPRKPEEVADSLSTPSKEIVLYNTSKILLDENIDSIGSLNSNNDLSQSLQTNAISYILDAEHEGVDRSQSSTVPDEEKYNVTMRMLVAPPIDNTCGSLGNLEHVQRTLPDGMDNKPTESGLQESEVIEDSIGEPTPSDMQIVLFRSPVPLPVECSVLDSQKLQLQAHSTSVIQECKESVVSDRKDMAEVEDGSTENVSQEEDVMQSAATNFRRLLEYNRKQLESRSPLITTPISPEKVVDKACRINGRTKSPSKGISKPATRKSSRRMAMLDVPDMVNTKKISVSVSTQTEPEIVPVPAAVPIHEKFQILFSGVNDDDLISMTDEERFNLESNMMEFMLRVRSTKANQTKR